MSPNPDIKELKQIVIETNAMVTEIRNKMEEGFQNDS